MWSFGGGKFKKVEKGGNGKSFTAADPINQGDDAEDDDRRDADGDADEAIEAESEVGVVALS